VIGVVIGFLSFFFQGYSYSLLRENEKKKTKAKQEQSLSTDQAGS
jgi:hypothetical protein